MNEHQFERIRTNRRGWRPTALLDDAAEARWLRAARQTLRTRAQARQALERILEPAQLRHIVGIALVDVELQLGVADHALSRLRQRLGWLQQTLRRQVPGVQRVRLMDTAAWDAAQQVQEKSDTDEQ